MNIMKVGTMCFLFSGKFFFFFSIGRASQCVIHALGNKGVALFKQPFSYIERSFFVLSRAWDKEKILSPQGNRTSDLRIPPLRCSTTEPQRLSGERGPVRNLLSFSFCLQPPSCNRSDEGLTLEMSALETLYSGQFTSELCR